MTITLIGAPLVGPPAEGGENKVLCAGQGATSDHDEFRSRGRRRTARMVKSGVIAALFVCRCAFATRSRPSTDALAVSCSPDRLAGNLPSDSLPDAAPSVRTRIENMDNSVNEILPIVNEAACAFGDLGADDRRAQ
jgi:hypothetical protein